jgi:hypothetical protein
MAYECAECGLEIDGDPCWYHPLFITDTDEATERRELIRKVVQSPEPPEGFADGALPFHRKCIETWL